MAGVGALISSLLSSVAKLLPEIKNSFFAPSSSSSSQSLNANTVENDLNALMRTLKRIKATLYDAEEREIKDNSVKLWLKELGEVGHGAEYVIDEYMYEVYRAQIEARNASELNPRKRKQEAGGVASCAHSIRVPDGFVGRIREIRKRFDEIAKDREALRLREEDGQRRDVGARFRAPSSHFILEPNVMGRERDKKNVVDLLFSNTNEGIIRVIPIVGKGGLGKTTLAQLVFNDRQVKQRFDLCGWICVSEDFNVEWLTINMIESFTRDSCSLQNLGILQEKLKEIVEGQKVFIVIDDVWNEDNNLWKLFLAPFMSALRVVFIITTRSDRVAKIMQTSSPFRLGYLSEEESWSLFQHHAFGGTDCNVQPNFISLGRRISKKCGGLPLAVKSISNLLRYENEESWVEILRNESWGMHVENDIFGALQISYTHMPAYLRPCFLYCSLFPKDYVYDVNEMIELWIAQGYIECKGRRTLEEIAFGYAIELKERSFFDPINGETSLHQFKMHDIIHDLARINSENKFSSIEGGKQSNSPDKVLHIYMADFKGLLRYLNFNNVAVKTLILDATFVFIDFSEAKSLRVLRLNYKEFPFQGDFHGSKPIVSSVYTIFSLYQLEKLDLILDNNSLELEMLGNLINLKFLSLSRCVVERIPDSLCFLSNLRRLRLSKIKSTQNLLPENIGNLVCLKKLFLDFCEQLFFLPESLCMLSNLKTLSLTYCSKLRKLPNEIGNLTNLRNLIINGTGINYLPLSFGKLNISGHLNVKLSPRSDGISSSISWLKDFNISNETLIIKIQLGYIPSLEDAHNFYLINKSNLKNLVVSWGKGFDLSCGQNKLIIEFGTVGSFTKKIDDTSELTGEHMAFLLLGSLQPNSNLKNLYIFGYAYPIFPRWMGDPLSCASVERIYISSCDNIAHLPFSNLGSLKWLELFNCTALPAISRDSLPAQLQSLTVSRCSSLLSVTGLEDLESLDKVVISGCRSLRYFPFELVSKEPCHKSSSIGMKNLNTPKTMNIRWCPNLKLAENEVIPSVHYNIKIHDCPGLKRWCLRHNISYL